MGHIRENEGEFQHFKLMKMLDKLLRNKQTLPFDSGRESTIPAEVFECSLQEGPELTVLSILPASSQSWSHSGHRVGTNKWKIILVYGGGNCPRPHTYTQGHL